MVSSTSGGSSAEMVVGNGVEQVSLEPVEPSLHPLSPEMESSDDDTTYTTHSSTVDTETDQTKNAMPIIITNLPSKRSSTRAKQRVPLEAEVLSHISQDENMYEEFSKNSNPAPNMSPGLSARTSGSLARGMMLHDDTSSSDSDDFSGFHDVEEDMSDIRQCNFVETAEEEMLKVRDRRDGVSFPSKSQSQPQPQPHSHSHSQPAPIIQTQSATPIKAGTGTGTGKSSLKPSSLPSAMSMYHPDMASHQAISLPDETFGSFSQDEEFQTPNPQNGAKMNYYSSSSATATDPTLDGKVIQNGTKENRTNNGLKKYTKPASASATGPGPGPKIIFPSPRQYPSFMDSVVKNGNCISVVMDPDRIPLPLPPREKTRIGLVPTQNLYLTPQIVCKSLSSGTSPGQQHTEHQHDYPSLSFHDWSAIMTDSKEKDKKKEGQKDKQTESESDQHPSQRDRDRESGTGSGSEKAATSSIRSTPRISATTTALSGQDLDNDADADVDIDLDEMDDEFDPEIGDDVDYDYKSIDSMENLVETPLPNAGPRGNVTGWTSVIHAMKISLMSHAGLFRGHNFTSDPLYVLGKAYDLSSSLTSSKIKKSTQTQTQTQTQTIDDGATKKNTRHSPLLSGKIGKNAKSQPMKTESCTVTDGVGTGTGTGSAPSSASISANTNTSPDSTTSGTGTGTGTGTAAGCQDGKGYKTHSTSSASFTFEKALQRPDAIQASIADVMAHFSSLVWVTYRRGFPDISDYTYYRSLNKPIPVTSSRVGLGDQTSDRGWGCMLRSAQMLLCTALITHRLTSSFFHSNYTFDLTSKLSTGMNFFSKKPLIKVSDTPPKAHGHFPGSLPVSPPAPAPVPVSIPEEGTGLGDNEKRKRTWSWKRTSAEKSVDTGMIGTGAGTTGTGTGTGTQHDPSVPQVLHKPPVEYAEIIQQFLDYPEFNFSIHKLVTSGRQIYSKGAGEWFGPHESAHIIMDLFKQHSFLKNFHWDPIHSNSNSNSTSTSTSTPTQDNGDVNVNVDVDAGVRFDKFAPLKGGMRIYLVPMSMICIDDLLKSCIAPCEVQNFPRFLSRFKKVMSGLVLPEYAADLGFEPTAQCLSTPGLVPPFTKFRQVYLFLEREIPQTLPVLILAPLQLGQDTIDQAYIDSLAQLFQLPSSVGVMGGRPKASLYFVGSQRHRLFYLDPHTTQDCVSLENSAIEALRGQTASFHCQDMRSISIEALDPSMTAGFYCATRYDILSLIYSFITIRDSCYQWNHLISQRTKTKPSSVPMNRQGYGQMSAQTHTQPQAMNQQADLTAELATQLKQRHIFEVLAFIPSYMKECDETPTSPGLDFDDFDEQGLDQKKEQKKQKELESSKLKATHLNQNLQSKPKPKPLAKSRKSRKSAKSGKAKKSDLSTQRSTWKKGDRVKPGKKLPKTVITKSIVEESFMDVDLDSFENCDIDEFHSHSDLSEHEHDHDHAEDEDEDEDEADTNIDDYEDYYDEDEDDYDDDDENYEVEDADADAELDIGNTSIANENQKDERPVSNPVGVTAPVTKNLSDNNENDALESENENENDEQDLASPMSSFDFDEMPTVKSSLMPDMEQKERDEVAFEHPLQKKLTESSDDDDDDNYHLQTPQKAGSVQHLTTKSSLQSHYTDDMNQTKTKSNTKSNKISGKQSKSESPTSSPEDTLSDYCLL